MSVIEVGVKRTILSIERVRKIKLYDLDVDKIDYENIENNPFLGLIKAEPYLYEVFKFNGNWCVLGIIGANKEYGGIHKLKKFNLKETETNYEAEITCPICGSVDGDSWECADEDNEYQCGTCGAILEVSRNVEVTYSATVKELPTILT